MPVMTWDNFLDAYPGHIWSLPGCTRGNGSVTCDGPGSIFSREWPRRWSLVGIGLSRTRIRRRFISPTREQPMRRNCVRWWAPSPSALAFNGTRRRLFGSKRKPKGRLWMRWRPGPALRRDIRSSESNIDSGGPLGLITGRPGRRAVFTQPRRSRSRGRAKSPRSVRDRTSRSRPGRNRHLRPVPSARR